MATTEVPDRWHEATTKIPNMIRGDQCIVLSFFSGIEVAALAVHQLIGPPLLHLTWHDDVHCQAVIVHHFPDSIQRGDILQEDARQVLHLIERHDPHQAALVVFLAAPPCPDFSQIKADNAGLQGQEGSKFTAYVNLASQIEDGLGGRQVRHLAENVVIQQKSEVDFISSKLRASPVVMDVCDFGITSRPRIWWSRTSWTDNTEGPITNEQLRRGRLHSLPRLFYDGPKDDVDSYHLWSHSCSQQILSGQVRMPCLTTPAPDDRGRPAPKRAKGKTSEETRNRWLKSGRQYAPWHYESAVLMEDTSGQLVTPPIWVKEQMHHLPVDFTNVGDIPDRERHKMLGNSWHLGIAKFLLLFILQLQNTTAIPMTPRTSAIQFMIQQANFSRPMLGPGTWDSQFFVMEPTEDMISHWEAAQRCRHPQLAEPLPYTTPLKSFINTTKTSQG